MPLDFVGFEIGDAFVYGYGLDVAHELRNLPIRYQPRDRVRRDEPHSHRPARARRRRRLLLVLLVALLVFYSLALSQGWLDRTPPALEAQIPERVPAGRPFEVFVSASEPVVYSYTYGGQTSEAVTQNLRLKLPTRAGENGLELTATDGADNTTTARYTVTGVPETRPRVQATEAVVAGDPVGVQLSFTSDPKVENVAVTLDGAPLRVFRSAARAVAFGSVPLGSETGTLPLTVTVTDEFGRAMRVAREVAVTADPRAVELLNLSPEVLSSSTPENKVLEEETLTAAYAEGTARPRWRRPFLLPIAGEASSSFGASRQYGPGGNISHHQGADLAAPEGTPIHATNAGIVRVADFFPIKGGLVVLDHGGGVFSLYFHQSKLRVKAGDEVGRGQVVGEVGTTGLSTGPHLHWEMRVDEVATNPLEWVGKVVP